MMSAIGAMSAATAAAIPARHGRRERHARRTAALALLLAGILAALWIPAAGAQGTSVEAAVQRISAKLRCPTCQGLSVKDSDASFSVQIRDKVRRMVEEGQSDEAIQAYFESRYGEWILRAPHKSGLGLVAWVLPLLLVLGGGLWIGLYVWRQGLRRSGAGPVPAEPLSAWQRQQLEVDRRQFEDEED